MGDAVVVRCRVIRAVRWDGEEEKVEERFARGGQSLCDDAKGAGEEGDEGGGGAEGPVPN